MATRRTLTVSITPELRVFIEERLATGRYGSASEVVRAGLRSLERMEAITTPRIHRPRVVKFNG